MALYEEHLKIRRNQSIEEWVDFLRIPSISALSEHAGDVQKAAEWIASRLGAAGVENAKVMPTGGHPAVYGEWLHAPGKPTVLIYGHFDVQPVDPLELWTNPPFEPTVRSGRMYARGASDMKGDMLGTVIAVEALLKTQGALPVNVKFLFEGQEEIGSPQMDAFIAANRELLACDVVVNGDGGQWSEKEPALLVGLRGSCGLEIDITGAKTDLHSGGYGGAVANPLHALTELLASMHASDGSVAVEGFYDDVAPLTAEDRAQIASVPFVEADYKARLGLDDVYGESGYTTLERTWARPTLELVGMWGGFQGEGIKTVLPREAHAKVSCRLVPNQDPACIVAALEAHVQKHKPAGVKIATRPETVFARAYVVSASHPGMEAARGVLTDLYGREPFHIRMGGSVPITELFLRHLKAHSISFGFGLNDEQVHAPNEFMRLASFDRGQVAYCKLLEKMATAL